MIINISSWEMLLIIGYMSDYIYDMYKRDQFDERFDDANKLMSRLVSIYIEHERMIKDETKSNQEPQEGHEDF